MSRFLPQSVFGQTLIILLAGLIISHAIGSWIYSVDREQAVRTIGGFAAAQRIANLTRLVQDTPHNQRERLVSILSDPSFRLTLLSTQPANTAGSDGPAAQAIAQFLSEELALGQARQPRVPVIQIDDDAPGWRGERIGGMGRGYGPMGHGPMMHGYMPFSAFRTLQVAIPLPEGPWLLFVTAVPQSGPGYSGQFLFSMAVMALIIGAVTIWAVRRVTLPLAALASAAERLGRNVNSPPLAEGGSVETRQASRAFNEMQARLRTLINNRTRMLAAISHDLRTPLTLLRLRAENVENIQERERMLAAIAEIDTMIAATLQFAKDEAVHEDHRPTDLAALLQSSVDDMADAGLPVTMQSSEPLVYECQPVAFKRAINNLLDNAVKYGTSANATIRRNQRDIEIVIDDEGPGIPEGEISRVTEPFYRLDESRSGDTGGVGLGLAIAASIVQSLGGELKLVNRAEGGLRASILLPI